MSKCSIREVKEEETRYLRRQFPLDAFPTSFIQKTTQKHAPRLKIRQKIPYIVNITETVARFLKPYGVGVAHRPIGTLHSRLVRIEHRFDPCQHSSMIGADIGHVFDFFKARLFKEAWLSSKSSINKCIDKSRRLTQFCQRQSADVWPWSRVKQYLLQ